MEIKKQIEEKMAELSQLTESLREHAGNPENSPTKPLKAWDLLSRLNNFKDFDEKLAKQRWVMAKKQAQGLDGLALMRMHDQVRYLWLPYPPKTLLAEDCYNTDGEAGTFRRTKEKING